MDQAFVTLATNDTYSLGALVWAHSQRDVQTTKSLVIMITNQVTQGMRVQLHQVFDHVVEVNVLDSKDETNLSLLSRPDLGITFTKLHCWRLTQFSKCVFMDADTLVLKNIDDLFDYEEFSASRDSGWPDCFNSGMFVYKPSESTYTDLLNFAVTDGSFDGGDQGLLNSFFGSKWNSDMKYQVPFTYNVTSNTFYSYLPAFFKNKGDVRVAHFIGSTKPWHCRYNTASGSTEGSDGSGQFMTYWWTLFNAKIRPNLDDSMLEESQIGLEGDMVNLKLSDPSEGAYGMFSEQDISTLNRQEAWERGHIDYTGVDKFDNIQTHLLKVIEEGNGKSEMEVSEESEPVEKK